MRVDFFCSAGLDVVAFFVGVGIRLGRVDLAEDEAAARISEERGKREKERESSERESSGLRSPFGPSHFQTIL